MNPPKKIKIGYQRYDVVADAQRCRALATEAAHIGRQSEIIYDPDMSADFLKMNLLHEILHGTVHASGLDEDDGMEEKFITVMAPILLQTLRDNPRWVEYLLS